MSDRNYIYENAIISIHLGIADYQDDDTNRHISAVRNFYSGVLLLGKCCLLEFAKAEEAMQILASKFDIELDDDGEVIYVPKGTQTIDFNEMQKRFKNFKLSWPKVNIKSLQSLRNNLEHFHASESEDQIQEIIAECFPMVESFFETLNKDPAEELEDTWKTMLEEKNFYSKKKEECDKTFEKIDVPNVDGLSNISCPGCSSTLLFQENPSNINLESVEVKCKACGETCPTTSFILEFVNNEYGVDDYISYKDGGGHTVHSCPECSEDTYVHNGEINKCFNCNYSINSECARCQCELTVENLSVNNSSYCDYCDHMMSKDD
ncbi:MAG: hypothetical protein HOE90_11850 [Bacteriovoracaceae bacterium]|jgi:hypothetical protein|nr:hypothetical protein [Bacteriovoracaceae bacterium]